MKKGNHIFNFALVLLIIGSASCTYYENPGDREDPDPEPELSYVGSETCANCHQDFYNSFKTTGHPYILQKVEDGITPLLPFTELNFVPPYFANGWSDVSYAIGGFAWKSQFVDKNGYVYTGNDAQYNMADGSIVPYHADENPGTKKYDCGKCHTTGYKSIANGGQAQDGLPGMDGEFFAAGVQCEACHGMGSYHANSKSPVDIIKDASAQLCGKCHSGTEDHSIAASGGFIHNGGQFDEMMSAGHQALNCVDCHDPHISAKHDQAGGITKACLDCHADIKTQTHKEADCMTCHMSYATMSAVSTNKYVADMKTHIFKINPQADGEMFNEDGTIANGSTGVTLQYICYQCHKDENGIGGSGSIKTLKQLSAKAKGFHNW